jgi:phage terminase large subunit-like protein
VVGCHIVLRSRWCTIIFMNVPVTSEKKNDDLKDSFSEELQHVFDHSSKYHIKILF